MIAISTTVAAGSGLLVRDRRGLEDARNINTVVFDKTGTLTRGEFGIVNIASDLLPAYETLRMAAAIEHDSEHTIAKGIVRSAEERKLQIPIAKSFSAIPGKGVKAHVDGRELFIGGPALLEAYRITVPQRLGEAATRLVIAGKGQFI